jgi:alkylation response protein AidB-like acyl-CoA dehydrogenase
MISFSLTEDQTLMRNEVAAFAGSLRTNMRAHETARELPESVRKAAHEMGLGLVGIPEAIGGAGLGLTTAVILEEEIASGDPAAAFGFAGPGAFGLAIADLAGEEQAKALLSPFTGGDAHARFGAVAWGEKVPVADRPGFATTATKDGDGWRLDGEKSYVLNADRAEVFLVFAQVEKEKGWGGIGAFVVRSGADGLTVGERVKTLGLDVASIGSLRLTGVKVKDADRLVVSGDFSSALLRFFVKSALIVASRAVGLSRAAVDVTLEYCQNRKAFGKPVGHFQAIAFTLADRSMDVEASRALVWRAATAWDLDGGAPARVTGSPAEKDALLQSAFAISFAYEAAMRCGDDAVQLHGGAGFVRDYPVEKFMRDAKQLQLCVMTAEQADQLAAALSLGLAPDLASVLPSAEAQNTLV